jgi:hypothetical protein
VEIGAVCERHELAQGRLGSNELLSPLLLAPQLALAPGPLGVDLAELETSPLERRLELVLGKRRFGEQLTGLAEGCVPAPERVCASVKFFEPTLQIRKAARRLVVGVSRPGQRALRNLASFLCSLELDPRRLALPLRR